FLIPNMSISVHVIFIGDELFQTERSAVVYLICTDSQFGTHSHLTTVGESCRGVVVHGGTVYLFHKFSSRFVVFSEDGRGMTSGIGVYAVDCLLHIVDEID